MNQNNLNLLFLDVFAHEFKTPIAIIMNNANNIERRYYEGNIDDIDVHKTVEAIRRCCSSLSRLSSNVNLALSGMTNILTNRSRYDVAEHLKQICFMSNELFKKNGVEITYKAKKEPAYFSLDPDLIFHVITNLISNSVKYNRSVKKLINVELDVIGPELVINVKDNGIGIPPEISNRIFERYYRGDTSSTPLASGLGVGLFIVSKIIEAHKGEIVVVPRKKGACFKITIPDCETLEVCSVNEVYVTPEKLMNSYSDLLMMYM
ncbi:MAG: HAMP domain-containing sensor histidine kinase [Eubacteriales bacterium]|nr:HAMP domain-containing sensor histidine kinase [Eubacteriales bacterium]